MHSKIPIYCNALGYAYGNCNDRYELPFFLIILRTLSGTTAGMERRLNSWYTAHRIVRKLGQPDAIACSILGGKENTLEGDLLALLFVLSYKMLY
jgi:hypothetical protein